MRVSMRMQWTHRTLEEPRTWWVRADIKQKWWWGECCHRFSRAPPPPTSTHQRTDTISTSAHTSCIHLSPRQEVSPRHGPRTAFPDGMERKDEWVSFWWLSTFRKTGGIEVEWKRRCTHSSEKEYKEHVHYLEGGGRTPSTNFDLQRNSGKECFHWEHFGA